MSAGGISAGSVFVSIKADMAPFKAALATMQSQITAVGNQMSKSIKFPEQAKRTSMAAGKLSRSVDTLAWRFDNLTVSIAGASKQLSMMVAGMNAAGIRFTRMGNAVQAVKNSSSELAKANPIGDHWTKGLSDVNRRLWRLRNTATQVSSSFIQMGAVIVGPLALATKTFFGFERQMKLVQLLTNTTGASFGVLENEAKRLGAVTSYTATEAAQGMKELAQGGMNASQIMASIGATLNLAKIGDLGLGDAAKIIIRVSNAFGLLAQDASFVSDVIAKAAMSSSTSVGEMAGAFRYVAGSARGLNQSIEETGTLLAVLADNGIPATMAGRTLNQAFRQLLQKQGKIKEMYGIILQDPNTGGLRRFSDIIKDLNKQMANKTPLQRQTELFEIFGVLGGRAVSALMQSGDALDTMGKKVRDNIGFAQKIAEELMNTLEGEFLRTKAAMENLAFALVKAVTPAIREFFKDVQSWANTLAKQPELLREWGMWLIDLAKNLFYGAVAIKAFAVAVTMLQGLSSIVELGGRGWARWGDDIGKLIGKVSSLSAVIGTKLYGAMIAVTAKGQNLGKVYNAALTALSAVATTTATVGMGGRGKGLRPSKPNDWIPMPTIPVPWEQKAKGGIWEGIKKGLSSLVKYVTSAAATIYGVITGTVTTGFAVLLGTILAIGAAVVSVGYAISKWIKWGDDEREIEKTKKEIDLLNAKRAELEKLGKQYDKMPQIGQFSEVMGIQDMKRQGKTPEELDAAMQKRVWSTMQAIKKQKELIAALKFVGEDSANAEGYLATLEQKHKDLQSLRDNMSNQPITDPMLFEEEASAWEDMFDRIKSARDKYYEDIQENREQKEFERQLDILEKISKVNPMQGKAAILDAKAYLEKSAAELLQSIGERERQAQLAAATGDRGMMSLYGNEEGKKAFSDGLLKDYETLRKMNGQAEQLGDLLGKVADNPITIEDKRRKEFNEVLADRAKAIEERRYNKMSETGKLAFLDERIKKAKEEGKVLEDALFAAKEKFEKAPWDTALADTYDQLWELLTDKQKEFFGLLGKREDLLDNEDKTYKPSVQIAGMQNPMERLASIYGKRDNDLLAIAKSQDKNLEIIAKNTEQIGAKFVK